MFTELQNLRLTRKLYEQAITQLAQYCANPAALQTDKGKTKLIEMDQLIRVLEANIESQISYVTNRKPTPAEQAHINFQLSEYSKLKSAYSNLTSANNNRVVAQILHSSISAINVPNTKKDNENLVERVSLAALNTAGNSRAMTTQEQKIWIDKTKNSISNLIDRDEIPINIRKKYNALNRSYFPILKQQNEEANKNKSKKDKDPIKDLPKDEERISTERKARDETIVRSPETIIFNNNPEPQKQSSTPPIIEPIERPQPYAEENKNAINSSTDLDTPDATLAVTLEEIKETYKESQASRKNTSKESLSVSAEEIKNAYKESQPSPIRGSQQLPTTTALDAQNIVPPSNQVSNQKQGVQSSESANIFVAPNAPQPTVIIEPINSSNNDPKVESPPIDSINLSQAPPVVNEAKLPTISDALKNKINFAINSVLENKYSNLLYEDIDENAQIKNVLYEELIQAHENTLRKELKETDPVLLEKMIQSHKRAFALNLVIKELAKEYTNEASTVSDSLYQYVQYKCQNDQKLKNILTEGWLAEIDTALQNRDALLYVRAMKLSSLAENEKYQALGKLIGENPKDIKNSLYKTTYHDQINTDLGKNIDAIIKNTAAESSVLTRLSMLLMHIPPETVNVQNMQLIKDTIESQITINYVDTLPTYKSLHALMIGPMAAFNKTGFRFEKDPFSKAYEIIEKMSKEEIERHNNNLAKFKNDAAGQLNYLLNEENKLLEITTEPEKEFPLVKSYIDSNTETLTATLKNDFESALKNPSVYEQLAYARNLATNLTGSFLQKSGLNEKISGMVISFKSDDKKALVLEELKNIAASDKVEFHDKCKRINLIVSMLNLNEAYKKELADIQKTLAKNLDQALVALSKTKMSITEELIYLRELNKTFPNNSQIMRGLLACEHIYAKRLNSISIQSFKEFPFEEHLKNPEYVSDAVKYANGITNLVRNDILQYPDAQDRAVAFSNWIRIATICKNNGDFQTAKAIASTFEMQQLNLPHAKSLLDKKDKDSLINLLIFVDPKYADAGYKKAEQAYISEPHSQNAPYIPYIGSYTRGILTSTESVKGSSSTYQGAGKTWLNIPGLPSKYIAPLVQYHQQTKTSMNQTIDDPHNQIGQLQELITKPGKPDFVFDDIRKKYEPSLKSYDRTKMDPKSKEFKTLVSSEAYAEDEEKRHSEGVEKNAPKKPKPQEMTKQRSDSSATTKLPLTTPSPIPLDVFNKLSKDKDLQDSAIIFAIANTPPQAEVIKHFSDIETIRKRDIKWGIQHLPSSTNTADMNDREDKIKGINACFYFIDQHFQSMITTLKKENPDQAALITAIETEQRKYQALHNDVKSSIFKANAEVILTSTGKKHTMTVDKPLIRERSASNAGDKKDEQSLFAGLASLFTTQKPTVTNGGSTTTMLKGISSQTQYPTKNAEKHNVEVRAKTEYTPQKTATEPPKPPIKYQLRAAASIQTANAGNIEKKSTTDIAPDKNISATLTTSATRPKSP